MTEEKELRDQKSSSKRETIKIRLPLGRGEEEDVYVSVNDHSYLIKRGETVEVPTYVAEVLHLREEMLERAYINSKGGNKAW